MATLLAGRYDGAKNGVVAGRSINRRDDFYALWLEKSEAKKMMDG